MALRWRSYSCAIALMALSWTPGVAGTTGSLAGFVHAKETGEVLPGATVQIVGTKLGAATSPAGFYQIDNIPAGTYNVRCTFVGFRTVMFKNTRISPDVKVRLDIDLGVSSVEAEAVEVTAMRPPIQKDVTGTVHTSTNETFEVLPVSTPSEIISLQPGTTLENNIRGGKTSEVVYLVDGLPVQNLIEGGSGTELPQSSIAEMAVQTGGFDPEYGNALSGVVNVITKRATDVRRFAGRVEKDDLFGGQQVDHRNELDVSASGPITSELSYVGSIDLIRTDTRWWQDMRRFFISPISSSYSIFAKIDYQPSSPVRLSAQILYSYKKYHDYEYSWRFNLDGLPSRKDDGYRLALIASHSPSQAFFYTASVSRYLLKAAINDGSRDDVDTTMYQWDFFLRYVMDGQRSWWARRKQINTDVKADLTWRPDEHHLLKAGGEVNFHEIFSDIVKYEPQVNVFGKPFVNKPLLNYGTDYRYLPRSGSAYIQDKIELNKDGMLLTVGFRYEFLDPRAERPLAERIPVQANEYETRVVSTVAASTKHMFSPRIGFAAPFAVNGYFFINYGRYYQFPLFDYLYSGLNNLSLKKGVGVLVGNPDLKPEHTRAWEMSIKYALPKGTVLSATYFHKETTNLIDVKTFVPTNARVAGDYGFAEFVNNPYARASGIELMASQEQGTFFTGSLSYTFMNTDGISENARSGLGYYQWGVPTPARPFPLSWDQRHTVKVIGSLKLPAEVIVSGSWVYFSGRPYTYFPSKDGFVPDDPSVEFEPNNARMNNFNVLNLKVSKRFTVGADEMAPTAVSIVLDGRNVFNTKNVKWVDSSGRVGGELADLSAWWPGRRIRLGIRVEL